MFKIRSRNLQTSLSLEFFRISPGRGEPWQGRVREIHARENVSLPSMVVYVTEQHGGHVAHGTGIRLCFFWQ